MGNIQPCLSGWLTNLSQRRNAKTAEYLLKGFLRVLLLALQLCAHCFSILASNRIGKHPTSNTERPTPKAPHPIWDHRGGERRAPVPGRSNGVKQAGGESMKARGCLNIAAAWDGRAPAVSQ